MPFESPDGQVPEARVGPIRLCRRGPVLLLLAWALAPVPASGQQAVLSLDQIIQGMQAQEDAFNAQSSWLLRYRQTRQGVKGLPDDYKDEYPPSEVTNARKGEWLFNHTRQGPLPMNREPAGTMVDTWLCWRGDVCVERVRDSVSIYAEPSATAYQCFWFTEDMFLNAQRDMRFLSKRLKTIFAADSYSEFRWRLLPGGISAHAQEFRVRPSLEAVDGFLCHVLDRSNKDVIWVDAEHGFGVRRRIYYQAPDMPLFETRIGGFEERAPGIWLPNKTVTTAYNPVDAGPEYRNTVRVVRTNALLEYRSNDVPDDLFDVPLIEQGQVFDYIRGINYMKFGRNLDPLEAAIRSARLEMQLQGNPTRRNWLEIALLAAVGCALLLLLVQVWRVRAARMATRPARL